MESTPAAAAAALAGAVVAVAVAVVAGFVIDSSRLDAAVGLDTTAALDTTVALDTLTELDTLVGVAASLVLEILTVAVEPGVGGLMTVVRVVAVTLGMVPTPNWLSNDPAPQRHEQSYPPFALVVPTP